MLTQMLRRHKVAAPNITFVGSASYAAGSASIDLSGIGLLQNDVVVVCVGMNTAAGSLVVPSGWTALATGTYSGLNYALYYKSMGSTPDATVTVKPVTTTGAALAMAYRGVNQTTPIDATTTVATNTLNPPSITTVTAKAMVVAVALSVTSTTISSTYPTGYSHFVAVRNAGYVAGECAACADKVVETAGAENPSTFNGAGSYKIAASVALRPA